MLTSSFHIATSLLHIPASPILTCSRAHVLTSLHPHFCLTSTHQHINTSILTDHHHACLRLRRRRPAADRADRQVRALWILPAELPDLHAVGRGDGFAARPHLSDESGARR